MKNIVIILCLFAFSISYCQEMLSYYNKKTIKINYYETSTISVCHWLYRDGVQEF